MADDPAVTVLISDIDAWANKAIDDDCLPDFWDDLSTSENLAEWLASRGYRKVTP